MSKNNVEEIRRRLKKEFDAKYTNIVEKSRQVDILFNENEELKKKIYNLETENSKYKEWNDRLIEYMDLTPEQLEEVKTKLSLSNKLGTFFDLYSTVFQNFRL